MIGASQVTLNWNEIDQSILAAIDALQAARARLKNDPARPGTPLADPGAPGGQSPLHRSLICSYFIDTEQLLQISRVQLMIARSISAGATFLPAGNIATCQSAFTQHDFDAELLRLIGAAPARSENAGWIGARRVIQGVKGLFHSVHGAFRGPVLRAKIVRRKLQRLLLSATAAGRTISNASRAREPQDVPRTRPDAIRTGRMAKVLLRKGWPPAHARPSKALIVALCLAGGLTVWTAATGPEGGLARRSVLAVGAADHSAAHDMAIVSQRAAPAPSSCSGVERAGACHAHRPHL